MPHPASFALSHTPITWHLLESEVAVKHSACGVWSLEIWNMARTTGPQVCGEIATDSDPREVRPPDGE